MCLLIETNSLVGDGKENRYLDTSDLEPKSENWNSDICYRASSTLVMLLLVQLPVLQLASGISLCM